MHYNPSILMGLVNDTGDDLCFFELLDSKELVSYVAFVLFHW